MNAPKLSLFTPTNSAKYLAEAYTGILQQNYPHIEWVLVPNGAIKLDDIPPQIRGDPRVKIITDAPATSFIGGLKKCACDASTGDCFIEYDHDDLLVPHTLEKVAACIAGGAGFVFSDVATFDDSTLRTEGYASAYGWEQYPLMVYGKKFIATKNFDVMPRMLCEVYYAPDHIRVWSRKAYYAAGGHDTALSVGDDHDLICRTYLTGTEFEHIGGCGYLYRFHPTNTVKLRNGLIQTQQARNRHKYLYPLIKEWCRRHGHPVVDMLDLRNKKEWDYNRRLQLPKNSIGYITASDVLQFVPPERIVGFFNEAYDALLPGGYMTVATPSISARIADPTIVDGKIKDARIVMSGYVDMNPLFRSRLSYNTFLHFTRREFVSGMPGIQCKYDLIQSEEFYPSKLAQDYDLRMLRVDLAALKGQRWPGPKRI